MQVIAIQDQVIHPFIVVAADTTGIRVNKTRDAWVVELTTK